MAKFREFKSFAELKEHYAAVARRLPPRENRRPEPPNLNLHEVAEKVLDILEQQLPAPPPPPPPPKPPPLVFSYSDVVINVVSRHFNLPPSVMRSTRRTNAIVRPRQIAMFLIKEAGTSSYPTIGRNFGHRDHTTVLHAVNRVEELMRTDEAFADLVEQLRAEVKRELSK